MPARQKRKNNDAEVLYQLKNKTVKVKSPWGVHSFSLLWLRRKKRLVLDASKRKQGRNVVVLYSRNRGEIRINIADGFYSFDSSELFKQKRLTVEHSSNLDQGVQPPKRSTKKSSRAAEAGRLEPDPQDLKPAEAPEGPLKFIRESLEGKPQPQASPEWIKESALVSALVEIAGLLHVALQQALKGDKECGYFLCELIAILPKNGSRLRRKNEIFNKHFDKLESARPETVRSSALRPIVSDFISKARLARRDFHRWTAMKARLPQEVPVPSYPESDERLFALPDLTDAAEAVDAWTEYVVGNLEFTAQLASTLRKMKNMIGKKGKLNEDRFKGQVKDIVERIAKLPPAYYLGW